MTQTTDPPIAVQPNVSRLLKIADMIEEHPEKFDMADFFCWDSSKMAPERAIRYSDINILDTLLGDFLEVDCGTTACIGGWAVHLWKEEVVGDGVSGNAARILGLDEDAAWDLFFEQTDLTAETAPAYLRGMAAGIEATRE